MNALWKPYSAPGTTASLRLVRGEGSYVYDSAGRSFLNATSGLWNVALGHGNPRLVQRMQQQLQEMAYAPLFDGTHAPAEALAAKLVALSGGAMRHVYLSTTGSSAVEVALRVARLHHRVRHAPDRRRILSFDRAYHGCSWMNLSASGIVRGDMERWDALLPDFQHIPSPVDEALSLAALEDVLARDAAHVACLIMEPILGSGGIIVPSTDYCRAVTALCRRHGVLLVADEVATGGGRCGAMFASTLLGLEPDVITLSKGLNSGYFPLGATLFAAHVVDPICDAGAPLQYGSTQDGSPLGCAATLATLEQVIEDGLAERAATLGAWLRDELRPLVGHTPVSDVRGLGLMIGIELRHAQPTPRPYTDLEAFKVRQRCQDEGLLVYHFESGLSLFPPLTLSDQEAADLVDILRDVLTTLH
jgi:adenosylmethionine-8-amino-7-oxononanoate aminotransferase